MFCCGGLDRTVWLGRFGNDYGLACLSGRGFCLQLHAGSCIRLGRVLECDRFRFAVLVVSRGFRDGRILDRV